MIVVVTGSRHWQWSRSHIILRRLEALEPHSIVIEGGAAGVDSMARRLAASLPTFHSATIEALWDRDGSVAGPRRNAAMLRLKPDLVIAFHDDLAHSKGTADCVRQAHRLGIPVEIITGKEETA